MYRPPESPSCFGSHLWSATSAECVGGPDPGYTHPQTMAHTRERCRFYSECATTSARNRTQQVQPQSNFVPVQSLIQRQPTMPAPISPTVGVQPPPRPVAPPPNLAPRPPLQPYQPPTYAPQQQYQQPYYAPQTFTAPPHVAQMGPAQVPLQYQQPGAQMPAYLTMPEPMEDGDSGWRVLVRVLFRSIMKAAGHSMASFFDHTPMKAHKTPEQ